MGLGDSGHTIIGLAFIASFILSLAMAVKCCPLQSSSLLAIGTLLHALTTPWTVEHEIQKNLGKILLLVFMVSFVCFM